MIIQSKTLKDAIRAKYAWPGGYEIFGITDDGAVLCCECMRKEWRNIVQDRLWNKSGGRSTGWNIAAIECSQNLEPEEFIRDNPEEYCLEYCSHCNKILNP